MRSADGERIRIAPALAGRAEDPVRPNLAAGRHVGMLAIELSSRRRLRINGTVERLADAEVTIAVHESVGNCPRYIQRREPREQVAAATNRNLIARGHALDEDRRALVEAADTAFVGSIHPERGVDTSHRGGAPGFIRIIDAKTLRIPDYPGNGMFMTLGNFAVDPRAALAIVAFQRRLIVSCSGTARLRFDGESPGHPTGGTGRYWEFAVREWVQFEMPCTVEWQLQDVSPFNPTADGTRAPA